jgi:hypothetical membrane protein
MRENNYALLGIIGPLVAIFFISLSIILSPWFSWQNNALSDLGHSVISDVAYLFNFGLLLSGFLTIIYSITSFSKDAKFTSYFLILTGLSLQLVATFDEVYGMLHLQISILFFAALGFTSLIYIIEKRSVLAVVALIIGVASWVLFGLKIYTAGIAVPEIISSVATASWVVISALRTYLNKDRIIRKTSTLHLEAD